MKHRPTGWQLDPQIVKTKTVQYWRNGVMITAQMTQKTARRLIAEGKAFAISNQAVGQMVDGIANS